MKKSDKNQEIYFSIQHIDSLGQGVSKKNQQIVFIPKTLPEETGKAQIVHRKGKVQFAKSIEITKKSTHRQKPDCSHFKNCEGCAYLHTSYQNEALLKQKAGEQQFKKLLGNFSFSFTPSPQRYRYRNRIQLHYDRHQTLLGFRINRGKQILEVPNCLLPHPLISQKLEHLYKNRYWLELTKNAPPQGHLELYLKNDDVQIHLNRPYAFGGFTQVNQEMNSKLIELISQIIKPEGPILDCFGGKGNFTKPFSQVPSLVVDITPNLEKEMAPHQEYLTLNLYQNQAIQNLQKHLLNKEYTSFDGIIIDPPRNGWKNLINLEKWLQPRWILYISCFYPTMIRDLMPLKERYNFRHTEFFDFFPSTKHIETLLLLEKKIPESGNSLTLS